MPRWDKAGIPHKGWVLIGCEDIREDAADDDFEYETCEMCGNERIRYVHIMSHPDYDGVLRVGCECAGKMTGDYDTPRENERIMKNRIQRRNSFLKLEWRHNAKGNLVLRYKGRHITAIQRNGCYGFICDNSGWIWNYKGRRIRDLYTLKLAAFDVFDEG